MSMSLKTKVGLDPISNLVLSFFSNCWIGLSIDRALRQLLRSEMKNLWILLLLFSLDFVFLIGLVSDVFSGSF